MDPARCPRLGQPGAAPGREASQYTSLDQVWATPLAETRLDQYIERERVQGESFDATLSGNIIDATSRYNLVNLARDRQKDPAQVEIFRRLLDNLRLDARLADQVANFVAQGQQVGTATVDPANPPPPPPPPPPSTLPPVPAVNGIPIPVLQVDDLLAVQESRPRCWRNCGPS